MEEDKLLEQRKEKFIRLLESDKLLSAFAAIAVISLIFSLLVKMGATFWIGVLSPFLWFTLFIFSALSAALVYFNKRAFSFYPLAVWVAYLAYNIRTLNLPGLRDITTGGWTLGPDLDPFLFLRWAKYMIVHGSIMANDAMRYVPIGFETKSELLLLPNMMVWFHKIVSFFTDITIEHSAALFPAVIFFLTVIAFFFLVRKVFMKSMGEKQSSVVALIASFFLSVMPIFIPRTIAGIPEKESVAFVFLFMSFLFFLYAWDSDKAWKRILFAFLAGTSTLAISLAWGGSLFAFTPIAIAVFIAFLLGQTDFNRTYVYWIWMGIYLFGAPLFTNRGGSVIAQLNSPTTLVVFGVAVILLVNSIITSGKFSRYFEGAFLKKIPRPLISVIITIILGIICGSVLFGPMFVINMVKDTASHLIISLSDRLNVTVAENRQPFFGEWASSFGPVLAGIPITFWLFFIGSVYLFYKMLHSLDKKARIVMTLSYLVFLTCIVFSRYAPDKLLNGTNGTSLFVYALGYIVLLVAGAYYYFKYFKSGSEEKFREIEFSPVLVFAFFFLTIISARGAIRFVMMLVPPASIIIAYFLVSSISDFRKSHDSTTKTISGIVMVLLILSSVYAGYNLYGQATATASSYVPSVYNQQWQNAMSWVRENTPQNAVFGHWWDYGYWLQSIGERATVLDGGNAIPYWDYLMGRYGLTESNETKSLEFLYSHNTTHFLIDSTDIGKYSAFSSIGSDVNYDRFSWINTMIKDPRQTQETKNATLSIFTGGFPLDGDLIYNNNGTKVFIPSGSTGGVGAIILERSISGKLENNPVAIFVYQNNQYRIPLRYAYDEGKLIDFNSGLEAGVFVMPYVTQSEQGIGIDKNGALLYLSDRTVMSQLARLYLYNEKDAYFELVHSEDDFVVAQLKQSNATTADILYYQGVRGPIRIWEINYPDGMKVNPEYISTQYPDTRLAQSTR